MRKKQNIEGVEAVSRRKFMRMTAASAATLMAGTHFAQTPTNQLKLPEKVLIFGHVPQQYLKKWEITSDFEVVVRKLGIQLEVVPKEKLIERHNGLSNPERVKAAALAKQLIREARQGERPRPNDAEMEESARFFLAMCAMITERRACAATIACGDFRTKELRVPCAALTLLQDHGIPAGCQVDIDAVLTMVLFKRVTGWVSFMGGAWGKDDQLRVSHCVLSRKMNGPGASQTYYLAGYHQNKSGPTIHTDLPVAQPVTVARLTRNLERLLIAQGEVIESRDEPNHCRNMLILRVSDLQKLMGVVRGGQYHLVVACGHHLPKMHDLAEKAGIEVFVV